ncbi:MAG: cytochrome c class [Cyanobacteria bacterium RYN_339]|nr:cytochrome c class [Cyanobacteria bacterium RYN_339]
MNRWWLALALPALIGARFEPEPPVANWPAGAGAAIAQQKCGICHGPELIQRQRLTATQWTKEVDKMVGWGAPLEPEERAVLATYLARHFGPDRPIAPPPRLRFTEN